MIVAVNLRRHGSPVNAVMLSVLTAVAVGLAQRPTTKDARKKRLDTPKADIHLQRGAEAGENSGVGSEVRSSATRAFLSHPLLGDDRCHRQHACDRVCCFAIR
jgi:hypothetical protein